MKANKKVASETLRLLKKKKKWGLGKRLLENIRTKGKEPHKYFPRGVREVLIKRYAGRPQKELPRLSLSRNIGIQPKEGTNTSRDEGTGEEGTSRVFKQHFD